MDRPRPPHDPADGALPGRHPILLAGDIRADYLASWSLLLATPSALALLDSPPWASAFPIWVRLCLGTLLCVSGPTGFAVHRRAAFRAACPGGDRPPKPFRWWPAPLILIAAAAAVIAAALPLGLWALYR